MDFHKDKKTDLIREMLLKTVGKNPGLFSYYVSIQEAKELLNEGKQESKIIHDSCKPTRILTDC